MNPSSRVPVGTLSLKPLSHDLLPPPHPSTLRRGGWEDGDSAPLSFQSKLKVPHWEGQATISKLKGLNSCWFQPRGWGVLVSTWSHPQNGGSVPGMAAENPGPQMLSLQRTPAGSSHARGGGRDHRLPPGPGPRVGAQRICPGEVQSKERERLKLSQGSSLYLKQSMGKFKPEGALENSSTSTLRAIS